jgi:hypothetical protein
MIVDGADEPSPNGVVDYVVSKILKVLFSSNSVIIKPALPDFARQTLLMVDAMCRPALHTSDDLTQVSSGGNPQ